MDLKIIYEDENLLVVDKPAGIVVFNETEEEGAPTTLVDLILKWWPEIKSAGQAPRYGAIHRLDKDTSGILLIAKNSSSLIFFQNQFRPSNLEKVLEKRYIALVAGSFEEREGTIETLIGRAPSDRLKQKVYIQGEPGWQGKRRAITEYRVLEDFSGPKKEKCAMLEATPKTGRKHQIRCHLAHIHHPILGDKVYGFKNQFLPKGLSRQFLHASYLKVQLPGGNIKEFKSELPEELNNIINNLKRE